MLSKVMAELAELGTDQTKKTLMKHGASEPLFGVRIGDMKKELVKKYRGNKSLAIDLIKTGNSDAQYLGGLIMPVKTITSKEISDLYPFFKWFAMNEAILAPLAVDSGNGVILAEEWLGSDDSKMYQTGVITLAKTISVIPDNQLPMVLIDGIVTKISTDFKLVDTSLQSSYNNFLIALGCHTEIYHEEACHLLSVLDIDFEQPGCRLPNGLIKIAKLKKQAKIGNKRKKAMC